MSSHATARWLGAVLGLASAAAFGGDFGLSDQQVASGEACTAPEILANPDNASPATACAVYAMMASNAYRDGRPPFVLPPGWHKLWSYPAVFPSDRRGLSYDVYEYVSPLQLTAGDNHVRRIVIAVTGTDQWRDALYGSLTAAQHRQFRLELERIVAAYPAARVTHVIGHSLGGGLAMNASFYFDNVDAVTFNGSPRIGGKGRRLGNQRLALYESGEVVRKVGNALFPWRWSWLRGDAWAQIHYRRFHYTRGNALRNHAIERIAWGALAQAAEHSQEMRALLRRNCDETATRRSPNADASSPCEAVATELAQAGQRASMSGKRTGTDDLGEKR